MEVVLFNAIQILSTAAMFLRDFCQYIWLCGVGQLVSDLRKQIHFVCMRR